MAQRIPIRNLYYLLCYARDVLEERDDALVSELEGPAAIGETAGAMDMSVRWHHRPTGGSEWLGPPTSHLHRAWSR